MTKSLFSKTVRTADQGRKLMNEKKAAGFRFVKGTKLESGGYLILWSNDSKYR